jgi:hypothetical protein
VNNRFKFRVWDEVNNKFYSQEVLNALPLNVFLASKHIQQYTGLKDKNGKEIYEGDIIRGMFDFGPAGFTEEILPVKWHSEKGYQWEYWQLITIEVVGNIFQYPCKPDHNGECIICDCWLIDCPILNKSK